MAPAAHLTRVVRDAGGTLLIGSGLPGRGAWICQDSPACFELAAKRHAFSRALRHPIAPEAVEALRATLSARAGAAALGPGPGSGSDRSG